METYFGSPAGSGPERRWSGRDTFHKLKHLKDLQHSPDPLAERLSIAELRAFREMIGSDAREIAFLRGADAVGSVESRERKNEEFEKEFKVLGLGAEGAKATQAFFETRGFLVTADAVYHDRYFLLAGKTFSETCEALGDAPRIRHKKYETYSESGDVTVVNEFEFTLKGKRDPTASADGFERRKERGNVRFRVMPYGQGAFSVVDAKGMLLGVYGSESEAEAAAYAEAEKAMHQYVADEYGAETAKNITEWNEWHKDRLTQRGTHRIEVEGKVHEVQVRLDYDSLTSFVIHFDRDRTIQGEELWDLIAVYEKNGVSLPPKLAEAQARREGGEEPAAIQAVFEKGHPPLEVPLRHVPTFVEFEITFPPDTSKELEETLTKAVMELYQLADEAVFSKLNPPATKTDGGPAVAVRSGGLRIPFIEKD